MRNRVGLGGGAVWFSFCSLALVVLARFAAGGFCFKARFGFFGLTRVAAGGFCFKARFDFLEVAVLAILAAVERMGLGLLLMLGLLYEKQNCRSRRKAGRDEMKQIYDSVSVSLVAG